MLVLSSLSRTQRIQLAIFSWIVYFVLTLAIYFSFQTYVFALTVFPLLISAWLLGRWSGLLIGFATYPVNILLLAVLQYPNLMNLLGPEVPAPILGATALGFTVGWMSELNTAAKLEILQRLATEELLRKKSAEFEQYQAITLDLFCIINEQGLFQYTNPQCQAILGYTQEELNGAAYIDFVHPNDRIATAQAANLLKAQRSLAGFVNRYRAKNGSYRWLEWTSSIQNNLTYATARDITEKIAIEQALSALAQRNRAILQAASDGIHILDEDGRLVEFSDSFMLMLGYTREEMHQLTVYDWDATWSQDEIKNQLKRLMGEPSIFEARHRRKDGTVYQVELNSVGITLGNKQYIYASARDITRRKATETALRESEERFRNLFNNHAAVMLLIEPESGDILDANPSAGRFYGYPVEQLRTMNLSQLTLSPFEGPSRGNHAADLAQQNIFVFPHRLASGENRIVEIHSSPIEMGSQPILFAIIHDVTEREQAKEALQNERDFALSVMNTMGQGLSVTDPEGRFEYLNPAYAKMTGHMTEDLLDKTPNDVTYIDDLNILEQAKADRKAGKTSTYESRLIRADGSLLDVLITAVPRWKKGQFAGAIAVITDLSERKQAEKALQESEAIHHQMITNSSDGIVLTDEEGRIVEFNAAIEKTSGFSRDHMLGKYIWEFQALLNMDVKNPESYIKSIRPRIERALTTGRASFLNRDLETPVRKRDGSTRYIQQRVFTIPTNHGWRLGSISRDITTRKIADDELRRAQDALTLANQELVQAVARERVFARTDGLTGVFNRRYFFELATAQTNSATRYQHPLSVILFDIDNFKHFNDTYGHQIGDQMLKNIAQITKNQLREVDVLGRYGGEEFVILLPHTPADQAQVVGERIREAISSNILELAHGPVQVTISLGLSEFFKEDDTLDKLIQRADQAMYQAKQNGRNQVYVYKHP